MEMTIVSSGRPMTGKNLWVNPCSSLLDSSSQRTLQMTMELNLFHKYLCLMVMGDDQSVYLCKSIFAKRIFIATLLTMLVVIEKIMYWWHANNGTKSR